MVIQPEIKRAAEILNYLNGRLYQNLWIVYRILLIISVKVASAERKIEVEVDKNLFTIYCHKRDWMGYQWYFLMNDKLNYKKIINEFARRKTRRSVFNKFKFLATLYFCHFQTFNIILFIRATIKKNALDHLNV